MTREKERTLPDFTRPPVVEVVLGVQFAPLESFTLLHFGQYWSAIQGQYPKTSVKMPLGPIVEQFERKAKPGAEVGLQLVTEPEVRFWFADNTGNHLIQLQKDRFHLNWKKVTGQEIYPHYDNIKPKFREEWQRFCGFVHDEEIGKVDITQCEVTYVNHIELGSGWHSFGELHKVISVVQESSFLSFLPNPESLTVQAEFLMPDKRGRLRVSAQPAIRREDAKEVLQLTLTARGKPYSSETERVLEWLDLGHECIVRGFTGITTNGMHQIWGRIK